VAPWKLPFVVAAIAVPIAAAFYFGGPGVGVSIGALVGVAIVAYAVRQRPRGALGGPPDSASSRRVLVVVGGRLEDPVAVAEVKDAVDGDGRGPAEVLVLAPARIGFLDRWASDVEGARQEAQQRLVLGVASLAAAGVEAEARVGDEDVVQAVEDQLSSFPATEVVLVSGSEQEDPAGAAAAQELRDRLRTEFRWIVLSGPAAR
jgi:hypothetical protein